MSKTITKRKEVKENFRLRRTREKPPPYINDAQRLV